MNFAGLKTYGDVVYITSELNKQIIDLIEDEFTFDLDDNDIEYSLYGKYDYDYTGFTGIYIQVFTHNKHRPLPINRKLLDKYIYKIYQKINSFIPCELHIKDNTNCINFYFKYLPPTKESLKHLKSFRQFD